MDIKDRKRLLMKAHSIKEKEEKEFAKHIKLLICLYSVTLQNTIKEKLISHLTFHIYVHH